MALIEQHEQTGHGHDRDGRNGTDAAPPVRGGPGGLLVIELSESGQTVGYEIAAEWTETSVLEVTYAQASALDEYPGSEVCSVEQWNARFASVNSCSDDTEEEKKLLRQTMARQQSSIPLVGLGASARRNP
ncbi:hypothetical protein LTR35_006113 [Friedmanniomyces endolithicus]|uniref:Uncharacterized protein n=1 Tax=Friedmanniomyces endolithicus TaxID=329885 RepID=A0AAN6FQQ5_9PEZI|nr:hypothetical protein LTR35_006113 [Friedmanniomyces endolithicus]KAK0301412.1 hypothetical protein LTS00_000561 [Friedmanniomyces endolithicus]KAK0322327.1 hypothetical protein LTR82_006780 [Friedmanniomyces endolithicus]KAK1014403.1 hypothetical protein LTR54_004055 [Friedmanniomyces endolithicus]